MRVYMDNNATTPLHPEVKKTMVEALDIYGNPSSLHGFGRFSRGVIEDARQKVADFIDADPDEVIFKVEKLLKSGETSSEITKSDTVNNVNTTNGKTKILVVEDDQFLRELIVRKLVKEGFKVSIAIDGQEGLQKIISEIPDLVLLDIILPEMDGFEILKQTKSHSNEKVKDIPIILLSNMGQESDIEKAEKLGANDYLIKAEFTTDEIVDKIKNSLKK